MYRIHQIKVPFKHGKEDIKKQAAFILGIKPEEITKLKLFKRSIDARKGDLKYVYAVDVETNHKPKRKFKPNEVSIVEPVDYVIPKVSTAPSNRPVVIGFGPAGIFCTYLLAKAGLKPICFERGQDALTRKKDVEAFWSGEKINPESNVCFGEGGAGTFSDGKLNTLIKDKDGKGRFVLQCFHRFGAPEDILYDSKPHIGTDSLIDIIINMRNEIESLGGEVKFGSRLEDISINDKGELEAVIINGSKVRTDYCVLATGHSARDTFEMLNNNKIKMEAKAYAIGVRVMHPQSLINKSQYGDYADKLPPASYKLTHTCRNGRGVYSFCMCPGGYVVNATGEASETLVNGMSYSGRNGDTANSAIVCTVGPEDFKNDGFGEEPLSGMYFQKKYEAITFKEGNGMIPIQYLKDFRTGDVSEIKDEKLAIKGKYTNGLVNKCLPSYVTESIAEGMEAFDKKIHGFGADKTILCGIETRTSSPVRIVRDEQLQSNFKGIFPCGEGAGYAGGIMSAALDGIRVAEYIISSAICGEEGNKQ